ncbi:MAG TPA: alpha/beta hydrolase-fold protein [Acidisarcina sp.]|nr:alpha/beta hydrolase-fold protein [Acidisarcina sp.]
MFLATPALAHPRDTGFLNRRIVFRGTTYKFQVYVPEQWSSSQRWPVILFLHGRGERGSDGLDQTQVGLPAAIRAHPERWPFVVVMPQVPFNHHWWTDPDMMEMAMAALRAESGEFNGDPQRTYLTGLSMGGYGTWELAKTYRGVFAAIVPISGGVYWSYAPPQRWRDTSLPAEYASRIGRTPVWMFHGTEDTVVSPKQSVLLYEALKASGGCVRLWEYVGVKHSAWDKGYAEPELPRWLLAHRLADIAHTEPLAERLLIPSQPTPARINPAIYDAYVGEYRDENVVMVTIFRQGDSLFQKNGHGEVTELQPESPTTFFYPWGGSTRLCFEKDATGQIRGLLYRDDRHEEHWTRAR